MDLHQVKYREKLETAFIDPGKYNKAVELLKEDFPCFEIKDRKRATLARAILDHYEVVGASETKFMLTKKHLREGEKRKVYTF